MFFFVVDCIVQLLIVKKINVNVKFFLFITDDLFFKELFKYLTIPKYIDIYFKILLRIKHILLEKSIGTF